MKIASTLRLTQEYVPEFYRSSRHFKSSQEFLNNNELGLALESLIEMADESGHYFSETFWTNLSACAEKMKMTQQAYYCRQQIIRNESELPIKTPNGFTTIKLNDLHYEHEIATVIRDRWTSERHQRDQVNKLIKQNGFHLKSQGRDGTIYYVNNGKLLEIYFEMSGVPEYDLLLSFDSIKSWAIPKNEDLSLTQKKEIRKLLLEWLKESQIRSDLPETG